RASHCIGDQNAQSDAVRCSTRPNGTYRRSSRRWHSGPPAALTDADRRTDSIQCRSVPARIRDYTASRGTYRLPHEATRPELSTTSLARGTLGKGKGDHHD